MGESNDRLKKARVAAGFTSARSAALRFGWTESTYASHENGQTPVPTEEAKDYGLKFGVSPAWILTGEGDPLGVDAMLKDAPVELRREVREFVEFRLKKQGAR